LAAPLIMSVETSTNEPAEEKVSILIVDDRADKMLAYETILTDLNENLVCARSGKEALRCLLKQDFAVILLDVNMPGMDGFETAALIRQRPRSETTPKLSPSLTKSGLCRSEAMVRPLKACCWMRLTLP